MYQNLMALQSVPLRNKRFIEDIFRYSYHFPKEIDYLLSISHSKWGIRGMVSVFNNAVNNEDISFEGLEKMANTMGIRFI